MDATAETSQALYDQARILGVRVDRVSMDDAVEACRRMLAGSGTALVVTGDAAGIVNALNDPLHRQIIEEAELVTPDSIGVVWAAKRYGQPVPERVSGVDLADRLCALSAEEGHRIFLLGAAPGVAETAAERLRLKYPGCNIVGTRHGYFPPESDAVVAAEIGELKPDILMAAMGIPRQEKFLYLTRELHRAKLAIGVGGTLDVFAGVAKRAPKMVQKLHLEWLWRTLLNPKKIAKAKALPVFAWKVFWSTR